MEKSQFSDEKYFQGIHFSQGCQLLLAFQSLTKPKQSLAYRAGVSFREELSATSGGVKVQ